MTLNEYKRSVEEDYGECQILHAEKTHGKKNCGGTGNRTAPKGYSWIDYWRAMTRNFCDTLKCSSCGKTIIVGEPTEEQKEEFTKGDDTVAKHKAHGGHIWVKTPAGKNFVGGRYITPLCPKCNGQHDQEIPIMKGAVYCKELGASKQDD